MTSVKTARSKASKAGKPTPLSVDKLDRNAQKFRGATGRRGETLELRYLEGLHGRKGAIPKPVVPSEKARGIGKLRAELARSTRGIRTKLKRAGFALGSADEFLHLTARESKLVDRRIERGDGGEK